MKPYTMHFNISKVQVFAKGIHTGAYIVRPLPCLTLFVPDHNGSNKVVSI